MSEKRLQFLKAALAYWGDVVLWGDLDCSDLVARAEKTIGLPDRCATFRAQTYFDFNGEAVEKPRPGDLGFYGVPANVVHVIVALDEHHVLSADGASTMIRKLEDAKARACARVRVHTGTNWYKSAPWLGWRNHFELD